jgi:hypothetical protein
MPPGIWAALSLCIISYIGFIVGGLNEQWNKQRRMIEDGGYVYLCSGLLVVSLFLIFFNEFVSN